MVVYIRLFRCTASESTRPDSVASEEALTKRQRIATGYTIANSENTRITSMRSAYKLHRSGRILTAIKIEIK
jgi:hypothetical protein